MIANLYNDLETGVRTQAIINKVSEKYRNQMVSQQETKAKCKTREVKNLQPFDKVFEPKRAKTKIASISPQRNFMQYKSA